MIMVEIARDVTTLSNTANTRTKEEDGSKQTRVRFNLEGPRDNAFCFAEVSNKTTSGEFVYGE